MERHRDQQMGQSWALLVVDMQMEMANATAAGLPRANPRANPSVEQNIAQLLAGFRAADLPVVHVMHDDPRPQSKFRRDLASGQPMPCAQPLSSEPVFWKTGSSGFVGTGLAEALRARGISKLVIVGGVAAFCVNSTARSAANLGFQIEVVEDALIAFALPARKGGDLDAEVVLEVRFRRCRRGLGRVCQQHRCWSGLLCQHERGQATTYRDCRRRADRMLLWWALGCCGLPCDLAGAQAGVGPHRAGGPGGD
ncbi:cysteine hydrolase family protein [Pseudophaeobacter leonis]|uniref:cysteine hydrolase family protein n=1 Tax=Pseudophaeobacter leonis TaxID=1144477 RepID=UPI001F4E77E5|nr:cysteine hydrolase family protein [Pseudophaeobacter leonis]